MTTRSMIQAMVLAGALACLALISGCGESNNTPSTHPLTLTLAAANVPAGVQLGTLKTTITLPTGVSIPADATGQVPAGPIVTTGTAATGTSQAVGNYQASTRKLVIGLITTAGFGNGDYLDVTFDVSNSVVVTAADFSVVVDEAKDNGPAYDSVAGVTVTAR